MKIWLSELFDYRNYLWTRPVRIIGVLLVISWHLCPANCRFCIAICYLIRDIAINSIKRYSTDCTVLANHRRLQSMWVWKVYNFLSYIFIKDEMNIDKILNIPKVLFFTYEWYNAQLESWSITCLWPNKNLLMAFQNVKIVHTGLAYDKYRRIFISKNPTYYEHKENPLMAAYLQYKM